MSARLDLERLLTSRTGFDLAASGLQRAIARTANGQPVGDVLNDAAIDRHFGCGRGDLGKVLPALVVIVAGVRSGKSLIAGAAAVKSSLGADLSALKPHEVPRFAIVAPTVDNATATFRLLVGAMRASASLSALVVGEPTTDTLTLRRPDGRQVEIVVVAAHRGAVTLRSRWLVGFCLDEVALFGAELSGATVNAEELLRAGETRLVPGGQGWLISSPFGPSGLLYELYRAHWGKPGRVLVVHAPTRAMNPAFPLEQIEAVRRRAPDVAAREHDAQWVDPETAMLDAALVDAAVRVMPLEEPPRPGCRYIATWDAATRGNSWTLIVARADAKGDSVTVAVARQWTGSKVMPLDPAAVIGEIALVLASYGVSMVHCDAWGADALQSIAKAHGIRLLVESSTPAETFARFDRVRMLLATRSLELPPHPVLISDLKGVRKKALSGSIKIELPRTADGRHADFAAALALACDRAPAFAAPAQTHNQPRTLRTSFTGGGFVWSGGGSRSDGWMRSSGPPPQSQAPRTIAVPQGPGRAPAVISIPQPSPAARGVPGVIPGGGRRGGFQW